MPHYRKLWRKATTSEDLQAMPDDTTRLAWTLLPTVLDREGRGLFGGAWLRASVFPLREDVTNAQALRMLEWWQGHGMITVYEVAGRRYFSVPTWNTYQGDCAREAVSEIPPPPHEEIAIYSRPTLDPILTNSGTQAQAAAQAPVLAEAQAQVLAPAQADAPEAALLPAACPSGSVSGLLSAFGVGEPALTRYADLPSSMVQAWIDEIRERPGVQRPAALLVSCLEAGGWPPKNRASPRDNGDNPDRARFIRSEYADAIQH